MTSTGDASRTTVSRVMRPHALEQMAERKIPQEAVDYVLVNYHTRRSAPMRPPANPADILIGEYDGKNLKVYVVHGSDPPIVKTVVWEG